MQTTVLLPFLDRPIFGSPTGFDADEPAAEGVTSYYAMFT